MPAYSEKDRRRAGPFAFLELAGPPAAAAAALISFLILTSPLLGYPFGVDYGEGLVLDGVSRLASGRGVYTPLREVPVVRDRAGPFYLYGLRVLNGLTGRNFFAGRVLSFLATLISAALVVLLLRKNTSGTLCFLGGAFFLGCSSVIGWGAVARPEPVALCLCLAALAFSLHSGRLSLLGPLAAFAALGVSPWMAVPACVWPAARSDRFPGAIVKFSLFLLLCGGSAALLQLSTSGNFFEHAAPWNFGRPELGRYFRGVALPLAAQTGPVLLLASAGLRKEVERVWILFFAACFIDSLRGAYPTEDGACVLPLVAGSVLLGVRAYQVLRPARWKAGLIVVQAVLLAGTLGHPLFPVSRRSVLLERGLAVSKLLRSLPGPMISDDPCFQALAGRRLFLDPRTWGALEHLAEVDGRRLAGWIKSGRFKTALLVYNTLDPEEEEKSVLGRDLLPAYARGALRRNLTFSRRFPVQLAPGEFSVYEVRWKK